MRALLVKLGIISPRIIAVKTDVVDYSQLKKDLGGAFVTVPFTSGYAQEAIMEVK